MINKWKKWLGSLMKRLDERVNTKGLNETMFPAAKRFYSFYPQIGELLDSRIHPTSSDKMIKASSISATLTPKSEKSEEE